MLVLPKVDIKFTNAQGDLITLKAHQDAFFLDTKECVGYFQNDYFYVSKDEYIIIN